MLGSAVRIPKNFPPKSNSSFYQFLFRLKSPNFQITFFTTVSTADIYCNHLRQSDGSIEKTLAKIRSNPSSSCVGEVLSRFSAEQSTQALRFFIWAGSQPRYKHSSYMYDKACKLFRIKENPKIVLDVLGSYRNEGIATNVKMFKVILCLCRGSKIADEALWVLKKMPEFGCRPDTTAYNIVIGLFCEKGNMDTADKLMGEMGLIDLHSDMITYITMMRGFCDAGRLEDASRLLEVMREHACSPNFMAYSVLLDGVCKFGSTKRALELLGEMEKDGGDCSPNVVTYTTIIRCFCEKNRSVEALAILNRMEAFRCAPNRVTVSTLMKGLCGEGKVEEAYKVIDKVVSGGSVSEDECYSSLVVTLLRIDEPEEAETVFRRMLARRLKPDGLACSILMKHLFSKGRFLDGFHLINEIDHIDWIPSMDSDIYSILLEGLCRQSCTPEASQFIRLMLRRRFNLKAPYIDNIVEHMKKAGDEELVMELAKLRI